MKPLQSVLTPLTGNGGEDGCAKFCVFWRKSVEQVGNPRAVMTITICRQEERDRHLQRIGDSGKLG